MGVLNVTPDSFSDGGKYVDPKVAVERALQMIAEGAGIIDIGGESSRPGSDPVSEEEELHRVLPVVEMLSQKVKTPISIDTYKPVVADACLTAGAKIVNDISGLASDEMVSIVAKHKATVVIMHMQGKPKDMQENPHYENVIEEIKQFFVERIEKAKKGGVTSIILDPGIGFGKKLEHNLEILKRLSEFTDLGYPLLVGTSRKSFIGMVTGQKVNDRLEGTIASGTIAAMNGAGILRVHDVKATKAAVQIADAVLHTTNE